MNVARVRVGMRLRGAWGARAVFGPTTRLQHGDKLLIVASASVRRQTERRLRAVSRAGKLARWFGEEGH